MSHNAIAPFIFQKVSNTFQRADDVFSFRNNS